SHRSLAAAESRAIRLLGRSGHECWKQPEIDVHRLEGAVSFLGGLDMTACDVTEERSKCRSRRRLRKGAAVRICRRIETRDQADTCRFHVTFTAGHLAGKTEARLSAQAQLMVQQLWRIEEGVAMQPAKPGELGPFQSWNRTEDALLRAIF